MADYKPVEITGFKCPGCGRTCVTQCVDSRFADFGKRRRRKCEFCGERFSTVEMIGDARLVSAIERMMQEGARK